MMEQEQKKIRSVEEEGTNLEQLALKSTVYIGSLPSLIVHTLFFVGIFSLFWFGFSIDQILLILTTVVSLEAIYLAIFIQMTVNQQARKIEEVSEDVEDIQEDVEEISKDIDDIQEDVEDIQEDVEEIHEDVDEIQEDIDDIQEDVEDIQEDTEEEMGESEKIQNIQKALEELLNEVKALKK
jgi:uncharacterized protein YoxC